MKTVKVSDKEMNEDEFAELKQTVASDGNKKLLEVSKGNFRVLDRMQG